MEWDARMSARAGVKAALAMPWPAGVLETLTSGRTSMASMFG
jgi:hypothetical protein